MKQKINVIVKLIANISVLGVFQTLYHILVINKLDVLISYLLSYNNKYIIIFGLTQFVITWFVLSLYILTKDWTPYLKLKEDTK